MYANKINHKFLENAGFPSYAVAVSWKPSIFADHLSVASGCVAWWALPVANLHAQGHFGGFWFGWDQSDRGRINVSSGSTVVGVLQVCAWRVSGTHVAG